MSVGTQVASLFGVLSLDDSDFQRGLADADKGMKNASERLKDFGGGLQDVGANMTLIGAPFLAFGAMAVKSFSDSQVAVGQLDAVLKSTGGTAGVTRDMALDLASGLQKVTRFSDETVLSAENMLLTFTNLGKDVFPDATKTVLDMSQALGQDTKSSAIQLGKALNDPINGITALSRVGVTFTQQQKDQIKALVESGKTMEAQKIILQELQREFGGSAAAAGKTFAGQLDILKNRFDDLMETIGAKLLPIAERFIDWIGNAITWFTELDPHIQDIIVGVIAFMGALAIVGPIIAAVGTAIAGIGTVIGIILSPIGLLIAAGAAIVYLFKDQIGAAISSFMDGIKEGASPLEALGAAILDVFGSNEITLGIANFLLQVQDFFNHFQDRVKLYGSLVALYFAYYVTNPLSDFWNKVSPALQSLLDWFVADGWPAIQRALLFLWNNVLTPVIDVIKGIWETVKVGLGKFADWFTKDGIPGIQDAIRIVRDDYIQPFIDLLSQAWTNIKPHVEAILDWFKDQFQHLGEWYIQPVLNFIKRVTDDTQNAIDKLKEMLNIKDPKTTEASIGAGLPANMTTFTPAPHQPGLSDAIGLGANAFFNLIGGGATNISAPMQFANGVVPIPPVGGGSSLPLAMQNGSVGQRANVGNTQNFGNININANSYEQGQAAAKGFADKARSLGYSVP